MTQSILKRVLVGYGLGMAATACVVIASGIRDKKSSKSGLAVEAALTSSMWPLYVIEGISSPERKPVAAQALSAVGLTW